MVSNQIHFHLVFGLFLIQTKPQIANTVKLDFKKNRQDNNQLGFKNQIAHDQLEKFLTFYQILAKSTVKKQTGLTR